METVLSLWGDESGDFLLGGDEAGDLLLWGDEANASAPDTVGPELGGGQITATGRSYNRKRIEEFLAELEAAQVANERALTVADQRSVKAFPRKAIRDAVAVADAALTAARQRSASADGDALASAHRLSRSLATIGNSQRAQVAMLDKAREVERSARLLRAAVASAEIKRQRMMRDEEDAMFAMLLFH